MLAVEDRVEIESLFRKEMGKILELQRLYLEDLNKRIAVIVNKNSNL
jgi:hypothetical protein